MKRGIMKHAGIPVFLAGAVALLSSCATKDHQQATAEPDSKNYFASDVSDTVVEPANPGWPMRFNEGGTSYTVYEPQYDSWDGRRLVARSAVAVQPAGQPQPTYGALAFSAITLVDKSAGTATLADFKLISTDFPSARDQAEDYLRPLLQHFPQHAPALSLERLQNSWSVTEPPKPERLNNTPPKIIVATKPSVLVYVDGEPAWRAVPNTSLQRVINSRMLLLKDAGGKYYLHLYDGYLQANALTGPWTVATQPPEGAAIAEQAADSGQIDLMSGTPDATTQKVPSLSTSPVPEILVATEPSELLQFRGAADFAPIAGTSLLYAVNTSGNVFKSLSDQKNYILISGRWYRAASLDGPWQFVPGNQLPGDFSNIPDNSPKENVKASVPGTRQANEALIANSIPQSSAVPRTSQLPPPQFDGPMQLAPIDGTPLHYVVNSPTPIIQADPYSWYACQDGVWYFSPAATGPWTVATYVPPIIYAIPSTSPLHYVTYVEVYGATPETVYVGYTPGYLGTVVAEDGIVVYGTGYYYRPWIGTVWYGPPVTWGWGFYDCWSPWWGWGYGCGFGWGWGWGWGWAGCFPPHPWWGGYRHWHDRDGRGWHGDRREWASTSANIYRKAGGASASHAGSGPRHREPGSGLGQAYNSRTGTLQAGEHARVRSVPGAAWDHAHSDNVGAFSRTVNPGNSHNLIEPGQPRVGNPALRTSPDRSPGHNSPLIIAPKTGDAHGGQPSHGVQIIQPQGNGGGHESVGHESVGREEGGGGSFRSSGGEGSHGSGGGGGGGGRHR